MRKTSADNNMIERVVSTSTTAGVYIKKYYLGALARSYHYAAGGIWFALTPTGAIVEGVSLLYRCIILGVLL
jgi:hypothetical protein